MQMVKDTRDTDKLKKWGGGLPLFSQHIDHKWLGKDEEQYHTGENNEGTGLYHLPVTSFHPLGIIGCFREQRVGHFLNYRNQVLTGQFPNVLSLCIKTECGGCKKLTNDQPVNVTKNRFQQPR